MSKGGGGSTVVEAQEIPAYISDEIKQTFSDVDAFTPTVYGGDRVAGLTPNQILANEAIGGLALNNPLMGAATKGLGDIISGQFNVSDPLQAQINSNIANAVNDASSLYARGGRLGSGAFGDALGQGITNASAPLLAQALEGDAARKMSAIGAVPALLSGNLGLLGALSNVGAEEQGISQSLLNADRDAITEQNLADQQRISNILTALGQSPTPMTTNQQTTKNLSGSEKLGTALNTANTVFQLASMFSDAKLKEDVVLLGKDDLGLNVYSWKWNNEAKKVGADSQPAKGYLAHEIERVYPEAVSTGREGYKMVDYLKLPEVA